MSGRRQAGVTIWVKVSDLHVPKIHWPTWRCFLLWLAALRAAFPRVRIVVVFNGDLLDFPTISRFGPTGDRDPNILPDLRMFARECNTVRALCDHVIVREGNHEQRYWQKLVGSAPREFHGLIGLTLREQLAFQGLDESVEWQVDDHKSKPLKIGHVTVRHGHTLYPKGGPMHVAAHMLTKRRRSYAIGHVHRQQIYVVGIPGERTEYGLTNPTMEDRPDWAPDEMWSRGWTYFEVDDETGYAHPYPILCEAGRLAWGGQVFNGNEGGQTVGAARASGRRRAYRHPDGRSLPQLARDTGIPYRTMAQRVADGWSAERLTTPVDQGRSERARTLLRARRPASE